MAMYTQNTFFTIHHPSYLAILECRLESPLPKYFDHFLHINAIASAHYSDHNRYRKDNRTNYGNYALEPHQFNEHARNKTAFNKRHASHLNRRTTLIISTKILCNLSLFILGILHLLWHYLVFHTLYYGF